MDRHRRSRRRAAAAAAHAAREPGRRVARRGGGARRSHVRRCASGRSSTPSAARHARSRPGQKSWPRALTGRSRLPTPRSPRCRRERRGSTCGWRVTRSPRCAVTCSCRNSGSGRSVRRRRASVIVRILAGILFGGLLLWAAIIGVILWSRGRYSPVVFLLGAALMLVAAVANGANGFPAIMASLSTAQPLPLQLGAVAGVGLVGSRDHRGPCRSRAGCVAQDAHQPATAARCRRASARPCGRARSPRRWAPRAAGCARRHGRRTPT